MDGSQTHQTQCKLSDRKEYKLHMIPSVWQHSASKTMETELRAEISRQVGVGD